MAKKYSSIQLVSGPVSALMLTMGSFAMMSDASASQTIATANGAGNNCATCHTGMVLSKAVGQAGLKNFCLKKYPTGKGLYNGSFVCTASAPVAPKVVWTTVSQTLGKTTTGARASDIYAVTCAVGTTNLAINVRDLAPIRAPLVSIQAIKGGVSSKLSTDAKDGDAVFSPIMKLAKGAGVYNVQVIKPASPVKTNELYTARFACLNAAGAKKGTTFKRTQDQ